MSTKTLKYAVLSMFLLFFLACALPPAWVEKALAVPRDWMRPRLGAFTGPLNGTEQDDNIKATMDLAHAKIAAQFGCSGNVWFVDSDIAGSAGTSWITAVASIDDAVNLATTNNGDLILVAAGHNEVMGGADAIDVDKHLIKIVGLGSGESRPTLDYTNVGGEFVILGDDVTVENIRFLSNLDSVLLAIDIEAGAEGATIRNCVFEVDAAGTDEFDHCIYVRAGSDRLTVEYCHFRMGEGDSIAAIITLDSDYARIIGNEMYGDYATANITSITTASDHITIKGNLLFNGTINGNAGLNAQPCIELFATDTGVIIDNKLFCNVTTVATAIVAADMYLAENWYGEDEGPASAAIEWSENSITIASVTASADG